MFESWEVWLTIENLLPDHQGAGVALGSQGLTGARKCQCLLSVLLLGLLCREQGLKWSRARNDLFLSEGGWFSSASGVNCFLTADRHTWSVVLGNLTPRYCFFMG